MKYNEQNCTDLINDCYRVLPKKLWYPAAFFDKCIPMLKYLAKEYQWKPKNIYKNLGFIKKNLNYTGVPHILQGAWKHYPEKRLGPQYLSDSFNFNKMCVSVYAIMHNPVLMNLEHHHHKPKEFFVFNYLHEVGHLTYGSNENTADKFAFKYLRKLSKFGYDINKIIDFCDHSYIRRKFKPNYAKNTNITNLIQTR